MTSAGVRRPRDLDARTLAALTREHLERYRTVTGKPFPQNPLDQVEAAVPGVLESWDAPKAREYRRLHDLPDTLGTAVILQRMVFGNAGGVSGSGVGFTRDPATGEGPAYIEYLPDAQGEDIVSGRRTPDGAEQLALLAPDVHRRLLEVCHLLEAEFRDVQEFEFTIQDGELFMLQARNAKRTPWAALQIAVDQVHEGTLSTDEARHRLASLDLQAIHRTHVLDADAARSIALGDRSAWHRQRPDRARHRRSPTHRDTRARAHSDSPRHHHRGPRRTTRHHRRPRVRRKRPDLHRWRIRPCVRRHRRSRRRTPDCQARNRRTLAGDKRRGVVSGHLRAMRSATR